MSVRKIIEDIQNEILLKPDLNPVRASEMLVNLSALLGNINTEIRQRDMEFKKHLLECYKLEEKANRAKIIAETSPEYEAMRVAKDTKDQAIEVMRSLKYFLKSQEEEFMHTR